MIAIGKRISLTLLGAALVSGCATTPVEAPPPAPREKRIDYVELEYRTGLRMSAEELGYRERVFSACDLREALGALNPPIRDCERVYFTIIRFRLACRAEAEPTDVVAESSLTPIANRNLRYAMNRIQGAVVTDGRGEATIRALSPASLKRAHLRLSTGIDFLMIRVNELTSIATPPDWCR